MERSWLNHVDFCSCSAPGLSLAHGRLTSVYLSDSQLTFADLSDCTVMTLRARSTNLSEATFNKARLKGLDLVDCDLTRTSFVRTPLAGIDLSSCRIGGFTVSSDHRELKGLIIDESQALDLIGYLGIRIKGYDA